MPRRQYSSRKEPPAAPEDAGPVLHWRLLRDPPAPAAWNMAVDEALAAARPVGTGILRLYRWSRPSLSFGRNQKAVGRYDPASFQPLGVEVVRRPTGGREVLHDRELTYSILLPLRSLGGLRGVYAGVNHALVEAFRSLGVVAEQAPSDGRAPGPDAGPCFASPAPGEVTARGRKLVGSAQVRLGSTLLQHGSILLGRPSHSLAAFLTPGPGAGSGRRSSTGGGARRGGEQGGGWGGGLSDSPPEAGFITLEEILGGAVPLSRVAGSVETALAGRFGGMWERSALSPEEREVAGELQRRYQSPAWTWRR